MTDPDYHLKTIRRKLTLIKRLAIWSANAGLILFVLGVQTSVGEAAVVPEIK